MKKKQNFKTIDNLKVLCIGVESPKNTIENIKSYYQEFIKLCETNLIENYETFFLKLRKIDSKYFFTKGKLQEIQKFFEENECQEIIISEQLSNKQEKSLTDFFDCRVFDRTQLILSIFEKSAITTEGKLQVKIAKLRHLKTRLAGHGVHLEQQAGAIGVKGPGETLKEETTRKIETDILKLKKKLESLEKSREVKRKNRLRNKIKQIALIGYTNSGKSTILNALTKGEVLSEDKLFATLDTTTKKLFINKKFIGLLSDTVGFIQNLPHKLIEAFKSTLSELEFADLLLCVIDISDENWKNHINIILETLKQIKIEKNLIFIFNKSDLILKKDLDEKLKEFKSFAPYIITNAIEKNGLDKLKKYFI